MHSISQQPATLGSSLAAAVRLVVTCRGCRCQVELREPEIAGQVACHGAGLPLLEWGRRLAVRSAAAERPISLSAATSNPPPIGAKKQKGD